MTPSTVLVPRQLWGLPTESQTDSIPHCTPFTLPSNGVIQLPDTILTLTTNAVFMPVCSGDDFALAADGSPAAAASFRDPFYASVTPQVYVIAATTVIAWILVLMLTITPRTSFLGGSAAQPGFSQGHGIIGGAHGGTTSLIGVGSRPWLQKVAALTVAISLTIATADTFSVAQDQYASGYMDATAMRYEVFGSLEIKITRVISDVFVWLAQVQTLIRLFPRHKEKVLIKWIGFALIICDTTFSCLNSFLVNTTSAPRYFVNAIPALSYLFELALGLLYAAWVIYYSITKRRYAFYHSKMRSISLIALLSLVAVLTPVVFFITDVSDPQLASWGDYFRWVGAAAASVVVWEWVERIEAVERDEKKDGILGREIYDDDDLFGDPPGETVAWNGGRRTRTQSWNYHNGSGAVHTTNFIAPALRRSNTSATNLTTNNEDGHENGRKWSRMPRQNHERTSGGILPPKPAVSPVSRTQTGSATSTVYMVRPDPAAGVSQPVRRRPEIIVDTHRANNRQENAALSAGAELNEKEAMSSDDANDDIPDRRLSQGKWYNVANPFKRKRASPPAEVQKAQKAQQVAMTPVSTPKHNFSKWDVKNRFGVLAGEAGDAFRDRLGRKDAAKNNQGSGDIIIIPAQPRGGRTWSPALLETNGSTTDHHDQSQSDTADADVEATGSSTAVRDFNFRAGTTSPRPSRQSMLRSEVGMDGNHVRAATTSPAHESIDEERDD